MESKISQLKVETFKIPGGPFPKIPYTTPCATLQVTPDGDTSYFKLEVVAQIPHGLVPSLKGPKLSGEAINSGLRRTKMQELVIEIPYRDDYGAPDVYFFSISYAIKEPLLVEDYAVYVSYQSVDENAIVHGFPDPELERGTVTTSGVPDP